ncbi:hypothetical protein [Tessaracoccus terricola]
MSTVVVPQRPHRALVCAATLRPFLRTGRHPGTNGWDSSWGTNAHGEIAGCPPPAR